ncbi:hypothetical protein MIB92_13070 [Aestuariirhabdus sp. Z084]|uniref:type IV pilus assembly protein FimV n=1 Tax=Aestuariirhabdus haliotis TaxID=2918751 RepID=UPI00201B3D9C|nr:hypothetical protein [Aestuariirhabdus haliotis]MCL6416584.1 hypothetical protein [Aestuariirhabdus haliotis]MCL6420549.1 hypothetical protein [Aestuariirhabdus haliotis]
MSLNKKICQWMLLLLMGFGSPVFAVGLGELETEALLGQVFKGQIPIHLGNANVNQDELKASLVRLADQAARGNSHYRYKVDVVKQADRHYHIQITSQRPIAEPYLDLRVQLSWPGGLLTRDYTVLMD